MRYYVWLLGHRKENNFAEENAIEYSYEDEVCLMAVGFS